MEDAEARGVENRRRGTVEPRSCLCFSRLERMDLVQCAGFGVESSSRVIPSIDIFLDTTVQRYEGFSLRAP